VLREKVQFGSKGYPQRYSCQRGILVFASPACATHGRKEEGHFSQKI